MSTIKDVANLANVSVTTVSRVLNNRGYIAKETRKKVEMAMEQLEYFPNQIARSLQNNQSFILGLIVPDSNNSFFAEMTKFVEIFASQRNYKILLCNSFNESEKEENYINMLKQNQVDGIIMCSHTIDVEAYKCNNLPIITFDRILSKDYPYATGENWKGGEIATEHLIGGGCKRLLHISGSLKIDLLSNMRTDAFKATCVKHQIQHVVVEGRDDNLLYDKAMSFVENEVLHLLPEFDGVFCSSDLLAYSVFVAASKYGIKVPDELKIVGYDNDSFIRMLKEPRITTVAQPIERLSKVLSTTLINMIEHKTYRVNNDVIGVELIKGDTT